MSQTETVRAGTGTGVMVDRGVRVQEGLLSRDFIRPQHEAGLRHKISDKGGGVTRRTTAVLLPIPTLTPDLPSPSPPGRPEWTANLPYKGHYRRRNGEFQHHCVLLMYWLIDNLVPTGVGINTFITIMLLALTTSCNGGARLTIQRTHICLILSLILCGSRLAFISPNVRRDMVPWSITRVMDLPPNAKLREMQRNTHRLVQLIRTATLDVPDQTAMPQPSKEMLNACPIPPMHIIVRLLLGHQNPILGSNEWHNDMNPACVSTVIAPNLKIKEITMGTRRSIPIPNQNIRKYPGGQGANPYNVAQHINGNSYLVNHGGGGCSNGPYADSFPLSDHFQGGGGGGPTGKEGGGGGSRTPTYMAQNDRLIALITLRYVR